MAMTWCTSHAPNLNILYTILTLLLPIPIIYSIIPSCKYSKRKPSDEESEEDPMSEDEQSEQSQESEESESESESEDEGKKSLFVFVGQ